MVLKNKIHDVITIIKFSKEIRNEKEDHAVQYDLSKLRLRPMGDMHGEQLCVFIQLYPKPRKGFYLGFVRNGEYVYGMNYIGKVYKKGLYSQLLYPVTYIGGTVLRYGVFIRDSKTYKPLYELDWLKEHPDRNPKDNDEFSAAINGLVEDYINQRNNPIPYKLLTKESVGMCLLNSVNLDDEKQSVDKAKFNEIIEQVKIDNHKMDHTSGTYKRLLKEIKDFMCREDFSRKEMNQILRFLR